jgi:hypothetical protein
MNRKQVNPSFNTLKKFLSVCFCITWVAGPWSEKAFNGFYLTIAESIILGVADNFVIRCSEVIGGECTVAIDHNFSEFHLFGEFGIPPAPFFVSCQGDVVIGTGACEGETFGKLADNQVPIFLFITQKIIPDNLLGILRFGRNDHTAKYNKE